MIPSLLFVKWDVVHGGRFRIIGRWKRIFFSKEYFSIFKIYIYRSWSALISFVSRLDLFPFEKKFWFSETNDILIEPSCDKNEIFAETAMKIWRDGKIKILLNNRSDSRRSLLYFFISSRLYYKNNSISNDRFIRHVHPLGNDFNVTITIIYVDKSEIEERLNDDLSRYLIVGWTCPSNDFPVYLARVKFARCNEYSHQTSPTVKLGVVQPVSRTAFPTNVLVGKLCSFRVKKKKKREKEKKISDFLINEEHSRRQSVRV